MHAVEIPSLGESVSEGVIVRWIKADGEAVALDEPLLELETDKASVEIPSPAAGTIHHEKQEGDTVQVGETVARIDPSGEGAAKSQPAGAGDGAAKSQPAGDASSTSEPEAQKTSPAAEPEPAAKAEPAPAAPTPAAAAQNAEPGAQAKPAPLSPAVRRLVDEHDLDPGSIEGSGRGGRITKGDVLAHLSSTAEGEPAKGESAESKPAAAEPEPRSPTPYPPQAAASDQASADERLPMSRIRRRIAERLLDAQRNAAILTTFNEADMSAVLELRARYKEEFEKRHGVRLGFMSFFARACIAAFNSVPRVNARIEGDEIVQPAGVHLGVAVGTERGLVVPVVKNAHQMGFAALERRIGELASQANNNKLSIDDLSGGTFTISNGGVYGSLLSTPILNPPQSGILGMHKIEKRPVVVDDEVVVRPMMYLALSYDHRLIDGAEAVTFLVRVKEHIEAPERLLFEL